MAAEIVSSSGRPVGRTRHKCCLGQAAAEAFVDGVVRSHSAADCSPSQPSRGRPLSKICKPDTWRQRARRATQKIKSLVVQRQSILDKHGQERAAMAETLEGVLVLSAKDAGESDRADATFKTLLRAAMSPFHVAAQVLSQTMFGGRVSRTTVDNARLRVARATDMVVMRRLGQWVASAAQDSVKLAIKGRAVSNPAITDQGSPPDNGLCDIERIVDGIMSDSGGCDPGRSSCALEASSSDIDKSSCALVPPSYHLDVVRRTDSTPLCVLAFPW